MKNIVKPLVLLTLSAVFLSGCGKEEAATPAPAPAAPAAKPAVKAGAVDMRLGEDGMPVLAKQSNCSACHALDKKLLGPAWMDVAKKYKGVSTYTFAGKEYPLEEGLIMKVSKGGAGVWGTMPMPANSPAVKDEEIKALVQYVLALAK